MSLELMPHQKEGVKYLRHHARAMLCDDPGLGKTAQVLLAAVEPVLVVAPAMLAGTWQDERLKWRPELDLTWVSYSSLCKRDGRKTLPVARDEYQRRWGTLIFDECHYLKERKSKWTQAALRLSAERTFLVTGTPIPNMAAELFVLLRMMHESGDRRYSSYWRFIETFFQWWTPPYGAPGHREITGLRKDVTWEQFAQENDLDSLMLRRLREDVLKSLPPLTESNIAVAMGPEQRRAYNELKTQYCTFVEENGTEVMALSDGGLHTKLAQVTTGIGTLTDDPNVAGSCKLDALKELLQEREGSPVVVFCHFRATARACVAVAEKLGRRTDLIMGGIGQSQRDETVRAFQSGDLDVLVGSLATLGEGVTLTRSSTCIVVERSYRPVLNIQSIRRLHRIGQTSPVTVLYLITENSLDERMTAILDAKNEQAFSALTAAAFCRLL